MSGVTSTGERIQLLGVGHRLMPVTWGVLDDDAIRAFTCGQCHAMAQALHELTGGPLLGLFDEAGQVEHIVVETAGGWLDAAGLHRPRLRERTDRLTAAALAALPVSEGFRRPALDAARSIAPLVVDRYVTRRESPAAPFRAAFWMGDLARSEVFEVPCWTSPLVAGAPEPDGVHVIDLATAAVGPSAVHAYTHGQQHSLVKALAALAYHGETQLPITGAIRIVGADGQVRHVATLLDGDRAADITGVHTVADLAAAWGGAAGSFDPVEDETFDVDLEAAGWPWGCDDASWRLAPHVIEEWTRTESAGGESVRSVSGGTTD